MYANELAAYLVNLLLYMRLLIVFSFKTITQLLEVNNKHVGSGLSAYREWL